MIGIDIVDIEEIEEKKLERILNDSEREYVERSDNPERRREVVAGLFAGKEAVFKAMKCSNLGVKILRDIEIRHEESGRPYVVFRGEKIKMELSISHTSKTAVAVAIDLR